MAKQKRLSGEFETDNARYRKASEPHESPKAGEDAINAFLKELSELRVKHKIKDLYVIYSVAVLEKDESETSLSGVQGFGMQPMFLPMVACAYGIEKVGHEQHIRKLATKGMET